MERKATYIRAWRKHRGYTQEALAGRMAELGVEISGASISRIESGQQPYSQENLEAFAEALDCSLADLLENDPRIPDAEIIDFVRHLEPSEKEQAAAVLKAMFANRK
jgi:transcriptional regulator with XRE-family HTH domain